MPKHFAVIVHFQRLPSHAFLDICRFIIAKAGSSVHIIKMMESHLKVLNNNNWIQLENQSNGSFVRKLLFLFRVAAVATTIAPPLIEMIILECVVRTA